VKSASEPNKRHFKMAPKKAAAKKAGERKEKPKVYDYSGLEKGTNLKIESEGTWYAGEVVQVSEAKARAKAPVKVAYKGYTGYDEWVGGDRLRSKAIKAKANEEAKKEGKKERPPLEFTFGYWKIRGLGAIFRMVFEYKEAKYTQKQYSEDRAAWFEQDKPKILESNPLANLPYLQCGNDTVCQTNAILAYLGDRLRLNGASYRQRLLNTELLCEIYDVRNDVVGMSYKKKNIARTEQEFKEKLGKHWEGSGSFKKFEAVLEKGGTDFFCGKTPCTSDFHIWEMLDQNRLLAEKNGKTDFFANIPKCKAFYDRFRALPTLQKYFDSDDYKLMINNKPVGTWFD
jgi:glutathione S-transferase